MTAGYSSFSEAYRDAVWESEELTAIEKAVAETYARYVRNAAGDKTPDADLAWLDYSTVMAKAGVGSRSTVPAVAERLVKKGWLVVVRKAERRSTLYRITIPEAHRRSPESGTTEVQKWNYGSSGSGTTPRGGVGAGSPESGTTEVQNRDVGSSKSGTLPRNYLENPPPTPTEINSPPSGEGSRDGKEFDLEEQKKAIVAKVREHRPLWSVPGCLNQINTALSNGRELDLIAEVFLLVAKDPVAQTPKWLNQTHQWWDVAEKRRAARPAKCARCGGERVIPRNPDQPASELVGCPACVPGATEPVADEPPASLPAPPAELNVILKAPHGHTPGRRFNGQPKCFPCMADWVQRFRDDTPVSTEDTETAKIYHLDERRVS